jgi:hypothetical protein
MTRRKAEITRADLKLKWLHHIVLPAERVRGPMKPRTAHVVAGCHHGTVL